MIMRIVEEVGLAAVLALTLGKIILDHWYGLRAERKRLERVESEAAAEQDHLHETRSR